MSARGEWNWRYLAYCQAHGRAPEMQLAADAIRWPGGKMAGFMLWIQAQWIAYAARRGLPRYSINLMTDQKGYDRFLAAQVKYLQEQIAAERNTRLEVAKAEASKQGVLINTGK